MLAASVFLLLAASANAAWVRPEARFAAPSGTACQYVCPAISGLSPTEDTSAATTTACNYYGQTSEERICVYDPSHALNTAASTAEGCPATSQSNNQCPYTGSSFPGNLNGESGSYQYYYWTTADNFFPTTVYCHYIFKSTAFNVPYGACSYDNASGAFTSATFTGNCPATAGQECGGAGRRRRSETTLEKVVRARQYKFSQPAAARD